MTRISRPTNRPRYKQASDASRRTGLRKRNIQRSRSQVPRSAIWAQEEMSASGLGETGAVARGGRGWLLAGATEWVDTTKLCAKDEYPIVIGRFVNMAGEGNSLVWRTYLFTSV